MTLTAPGAQWDSPSHQSSHPRLLIGGDRRPTREGTPRRGEARNAIPITQDLPTREAWRGRHFRERVILRALRWIEQDGVGLIDQLKSPGGLRIARIRSRMVTQKQFSVSCPDDVDGRILRDLKDII